jgi:hypothetical protein
MKSLRLVPLTLKQANRLVSRLHRHHKPIQGHRFTIGAKNGRLVGAAIVGRPGARRTRQYLVAEVTRLVSDGTPHVCSMLYAACARAAKAMGYDAIQTFILEHEPGTSLKAAGWKFVKLTKGGNHNRPSRSGRRRDQPEGKKQKWEKRFVWREEPTPIH